MSKSPTKRSLYSLHPAYAFEAASIAKLKKTTGKTLEEWLKLVVGSGPATVKERADWLKTEHGLGTLQSKWIANRAEGKGSPEEYHPEALVDAMFAGPKQRLRPIYDRLLRIGLALGRDVTVCPCTTIVPLYRAHVFAQIKPTTQTRIDLGLALGPTEASGLLVDTGGLAKKDRITHRIPIQSLAEIDGEVTRWLQVAYSLDDRG